ncbi:hypothetical protein DERF_004038 [Dermatophagoides farinae]|uniref:Uncharacterized protein n=1 Tax=Dermatophagoides farinae TaxID=6954 RepID=A0A922LB68_DERFA|nr:hypothetical protein DERF_004038 [Dermatophagoides farinae]
MVKTLRHTTITWVLDLEESTALLFASQWPLSIFWLAKDDGGCLLQTLSSLTNILSKRLDAVV